MTELADDMLADSVAVEDGQVKAIASLAEKQLRLEQELEQAEAEVKRLKADLRKVSEDELPNAMLAAGVTSFVLSNGAEVAIKENLYASIPAKHKAEAAKWLVEHGQQALVREDLVIRFDKGQHDQAVGLAERLSRDGYSPVMSEAMNAGSVKSVIKELREQGVDVPLNLFGAHFVTRAVIKK